MANQFYDLYVQLANHRAVKATKVNNLIAKTLSELSLEQQIKILEDDSIKSLEKIFVSAYNNRLFEVCAVIKGIMDK